ncbi:MAG: type IV pilus modification PilV family protein [Geminicoccaceae bacterium]
MCADTESSGPVSERGFTLLEVLVAFLIFALAFGVIARTLQTSLRQTTTAETLLKAAALAERQIALAGTVQPFAGGEESGRSVDGLEWRRSIQLEKAPSEDGDVALYRITVDVRSPAADRSYVTVQTLRLGPLP